MKQRKTKWLDVYLDRFKWNQHEFTPDALELSVTFVGTFWALYGEINRYSKVIETEYYQ